MNNTNGNGGAFKSVDERKAKFKELYPKYGSIGQTLREMGIKSRQSFYKWCNSDPGFKRIYEEELKPNRIDELVSAAFQIATAGRLRVGKSGMDMVIDATVGIVLSTA